MADNPTNTNHHPSSYAQAAAHNVPPSSAQPHPDTNLLYTTPSSTHPITAPDIDTKVSVVPNDWAANPTTETSLHISVTQSATDTDSDTDAGSDANQDANLTRRAKPKVRKQHGKRRDNTSQSKRDLSPFWRHFTDAFVRPAPAFIPGLIIFRPSFTLNPIHPTHLPTVNLGVLSSIGYTLYTHPHARTNPRFLGLSALGIFTLFSAEGLTPRRYLDSPHDHQTHQVQSRGPPTIRRLTFYLSLIPQEIVTLKRKSKEIILRPGVFGGLLGAINLTILASLSWLAYDHWNHPTVWTRRNLSITSLGLLGWFGGQG